MKKLTDSEKQQKALDIIHCFILNDIRFSVRYKTEYVVTDRKVMTITITCRDDADKAKVLYHDFFEIGLDRAGQRLAVAVFNLTRWQQ